MMERALRALLITIALLVSGSHLHAEGTPGTPPLDDAAVRKVLMLALDNFHRGRCEGSQPCTPATAEEKAHPPISIAEARLIIRRGALSAAAEHCGLDWPATNFEPMMAYWRSTMRKNERQMALIALVHGIMQGISKQTVAERGPCTDQDRRNLHSSLSFRP
jgi:hypothetical protein